MTDPRISQYYDLLEKARDYMYAQLCFNLNIMPCQAVRD